MANTVRKLVAIILLTCITPTLQAEIPERLAEVIASRSDEDKARDSARHPGETLDFFNVEPGMTVAEARPRLADFIDYSLKQGLTCVRIVHGKGLGSGHRGPVLKNAVNRWLRKWDSVLAFVSARQVDGGTGAVYVLLDRGDF